jgi:hypothetical protein
MKKVISIIILIAMIFMLEFNFFASLLPEAHVWFEPLLAMVILALMIMWNKVLKK